MILELFQRKCFAAEPAAKFNAFSGSMEKKVPAAFGAGGGSVSSHNCLVSIPFAGVLDETTHHGGEYSGGRCGCQMAENRTDRWTREARFDRTMDETTDCRSYPYVFGTSVPIRSRIIVRPGLLPPFKFFSSSRVLPAGESHLENSHGKQTLVRWVVTL